jgi:hypothetical protein
MCLPKTPKIQTPPPPPTYEQARTDDVAIARQDERKRLRNAVNSRTTILSERDNNGRKTLLGQ